MNGPSDPMMLTASRPSRPREQSAESNQPGAGTTQPLMSTTGVPGRGVVAAVGPVEVHVGLDARCFRRERGPERDVYEVVRLRTECAAPDRREVARGHRPDPVGGHIPK